MNFYKKNKLKVYLSGRVDGAWYRSQYIIKTLIDNKIPIFMLPGSPYFSKFKLVDSILVILHSFLLFPVRVYLICISTHIVVLPCNWSISTLLDSIIARIVRKKVVVDFYVSIYEMEVVDRSLWDTLSFRAKVLLFKDRVLIKIATKVIFLNKSEAIYYQKVLGLSLCTEKIEIVPLCVDIRRESSIYNCFNDAEAATFTVCWWGTYIPLHGLENIIKAFSFLKKEKNIILHIFGNSEEKSKKYKDLVNSLELKGVVFIENNKRFMDNSLEDFLINNCSLSLGSFGSSAKAKVVLTNKLVDSLSMGVPCLTGVSGASSEFFNNRESVVFCKSEPMEIAKTILDLSHDKQRLFEIGSKGRETYWKLFSPSVFSQNFVKILD
jgi:glycosyltransferase involved in cell wall biosynthesis